MTDKLSVLRSRAKNAMQIASFTGRAERLVETALEQNE
jgi:hypothetical protein